MTSKYAYDTLVLTIGKLVNTLDKEEFRIKLEEINRLVEKKNYKDAMEVVDSIDWRRVKNVRTLCVVGEIYAANKRYEDSKEIFLLAYHRAPIGKNILYRLIEVSLRMKDIQEAEEFYEEFLEIAPNDSTRYILNYKISKEKQVPLDQQIRILEEYKEKEFTERWSYELAKLYYQNGDTEKCLDLCNEMVLWFSEGKYVMKALDLKNRMGMLTGAEKEKYDQQFIPNLTTVEEAAELNADKEGQEASETEKAEDAEKSEGAKDIKRPEIIPGEEIKPDVDIPLVVSNLTNENFDVQAQQMEEIARISLDNPENAVPYIVRDVFATLIDITKKDTAELAAPTDEQIQARKKVIANYVSMENGKANNKPVQMPYPMSEREIALADEISPMEQAERNKEYALYTMAILAKVYTDEVEKETGNIVPMTDIPGTSAMVDSLRYNPNAGVKIAAIDALRHINRPEYKEEMSTLFSLAQADTNPEVAIAATRALNSLEN